MGYTFIMVLMDGVVKDFSDDADRTDFIARLDTALSVCLSCCCFWLDLLFVGPETIDRYRNEFSSSDLSGLRQYRLSLLRQRSIISDKNMMF